MFLRCRLATSRMEDKTARTWGGDSRLWDRSRVSSTLAGLERQPALTVDRLFQLQKNRKYYRNSLSSSVIFLSMLHSQIYIWGQIVYRLRLKSICFFGRYLEKKGGPKISTTKKVSFLDCLKSIIRKSFH